MDGEHLASDQVIAELIGMGFEFSDVTEAIKAVGPSLDDALEFILNGSRRNEMGASTSSSSIANGSRSLCKRGSSSEHSCSKMRQSSIVEHLSSVTRPRRSKAGSDVAVSRVEVLPGNGGEANEQLQIVNSSIRAAPEASVVPSFCEEEDIGPDWEEKVRKILLKHFGVSSLKSFQKEALAAWLAHKDCLVLAATGSGKSLCFQIPALLTGKVVVVISPLISLMHDQCLKLAKHGVSACFLGSGQIDKSVEQKAMKGLYDIVYVCPETILRLIKPLQTLAESRGIALFAIDEVHCISKWGHDFRPDYRRLSVLRENFRAKSLKFLKFDIPLMALTATATICVREDILKSLGMSEKTKIVLTSFFRPNLRFSVKHSSTSSPSSYKKDFQKLIEVYARNSNTGKKHNSFIRNLRDASESSAVTSNGCNFEQENMSDNDILSNDDTSSENDEEADLVINGSATSERRKLSVEYLEDECDLLREVDDLDVSCGEFYGQSSRVDFSACPLFETHDFPMKPEDRLKFQQGSVGGGPTIIYVPTRKETLSISKFLCKFGVKAAAYNAKLPKSHLRQVHKEFHENALQVVVATIAFGMGIDKLNVRRIIHYGWPQSLEAYYQEAGRAGRDGKLADCVLYANLFKIPTLLPSQRSEEQTKQAYRMLSDCFRYGMSTSCCRAKMLVEYFGEEFNQESCFLCDVCVNGPSEVQNLIAEVTVFMQVIAAQYRQSSYEEASCDYEDDIRVPNSVKRRRYLEKANVKTLVSRIREQHAEFTATDLIWWRGLARILEDKGFIREGDRMNHVQVKFPEPTELGLQFLRSELERPFYIYPEADMLLAMRNPKPYSSFAEWGRGWADPEIRRQRLANKQSRRKTKRRRFHKIQPNLNSVRGRGEIFTSGRLRSFVKCGTHMRVIGRKSDGLMPVSSCNEELL